MSAPMLVQVDGETFLLLHKRGSATHPEPAGHVLVCLRDLAVAMDGSTDGATININTDGAPHFGVIETAAEIFEILGGLMDGGAK